MKFASTLLLILFLCFLESTIGASEMDTKTLISYLNLSKTLIQDGEIKFMLYDKRLKRPEEIGDTQRKFIAMHEQKLHQTDENLTERRKDILKDIAELKKYGGFRDTSKHFGFFEVNLIFQVKMEPIAPQSQDALSHLSFCIEMIDRFEKFPSLEQQRYNNAGKQILFFRKEDKVLNLIYPPQFTKTNTIGLIEYSGWSQQFPPIYPVNYIDESDAKVTQTHSGTGEPILHITHFPYEGETVKVKLYIRFVEAVPEVFQEEFHYQSESPIADEDGYWLRVKNLYSDFESVPSLNIRFPRHHVAKYYESDGWQRRQEIVSIKEMNVNLGLPANFFDWTEEEIRLEDGQMAITDYRGEDLE